jgi:hypothetical protein
MRAGWHAGLSILLQAPVSVRLVSRLGGLAMRCRGLKRDCARPLWGCIVDDKKAEVRVHTPKKGSHTPGPKRLGWAVCVLERSWRGMVGRGAARRRRRGWDRNRSAPRQEDRHLRDRSPHGHDQRAQVTRLAHVPWWSFGHRYSSCTPVSPSYVVKVAAPKVYAPVAPTPIAPRGEPQRPPHNRRGRNRASRAASQLAHSSRAALTSSSAFELSGTLWARAASRSSVTPVGLGMFRQVRLEGPATPFLDLFLWPRG